MYDEITKLALKGDFVGLGKVGLALAAVQLVSTAVVSTAMVVADAMVSTQMPKPRKLSNPIVFKSHDEARAEAENK